MKKELITIIVLFAIALIFSIYFDYGDNLVSDGLSSSVCINDGSSQSCFAVEVAQTSEQRQQGLMYREYLARDRGMLFVFDSQGIYPFWMKNTLIPLDMIWIDNNNKVVHVAFEVPPCEEEPCPSVIPSEKATYVLEVASGVAREKGISIGDDVLINNLE